MLLSSLIGCAIVGWTNESYSDEPANGLTVILKGEGDTEIAPHTGGNVYAPDVIWDGKSFWMWYGGQGKDGHDRIACAVSEDGRKWVRKGVVIQNGNANQVNDPSVVIMKGKFLMYYTRTEKDVVDRIDVAISDDGIKWEPKGLAVAAGPDGSWDSLSVGRPTVIFDGGQFQMWYDGRKDFPPNAPVKNVPKSPSSHRSVGYATSKDGFKWTKHENNPVFGNDAGAVDVKRLGDHFIMLYESGEGTRFAISNDGLEWKDGGIFMNKSGQSIDSFGHVTPFLFIDPENKRHRLFFGAASARTWDHNCVAVVEIDREYLSLLK